MTEFIDVLAYNQDRQKLITGHNKLKIIVTYNFLLKILLIFNLMFFRHKKTLFP